MKIHVQVKEQGTRSTYLLNSTSHVNVEERAFILDEARSLYHIFRTRIDLLFRIASQLESRGAPGDVYTVDRRSLPCGC